MWQKSGEEAHMAEIVLKSYIMSECKDAKSFSLHYQHIHTTVRSILLI